MTSLDTLFSVINNSKKLRYSESSPTKFKNEAEEIISRYAVRVKPGYYELTGHPIALPIMHHAADICNCFADSFWKHFNNSCQRIDIAAGRSISQLIASNRWDQPTISIICESQILEFFQQTGFMADGEPNTLDTIMVLGFSSPLKHLWNDRVNRQVGRRIPWGKVLKASKKDLWHSKLLNGNGVFKLERINEIGDHDPDWYHYLWWIVPNRPN